MPSVAANPGNGPAPIQHHGGTLTDDVRRFYTIDEATLTGALEAAAGGHHPGVLVAGLYARAANPVDPAVALTVLTGYPALLRHLDTPRSHGA